MTNTPGAKAGGFHLPSVSGFSDSLFHFLQLYKHSVCVSVGLFFQTT